LFINIFSRELRSWIDGENSKFLERKKGAKEKVYAAKEKVYTHCKW